MPPLARILLFLLLGFVDLSLSWLLFTHRSTSTQITEGNPFASSVFTQHGWVGLALFKACCSATVLAIYLVVVRYRQSLANRVLYLGIFAVGGVIVYSCTLTAYLGLTHSPWVTTLASPTLSPEEAEFVLRNLRPRLTKELIRGECTLASAVYLIERRLARVEIQPAQIRRVRSENPGMGYVHCLHHILLEAALIELQSRDPVEAIRIASRLMGEYRTYFDEPLPSILQLAKAIESSSTSQRQRTESAPADNRGFAGGAPNPADVGLSRTTDPTTNEDRPAKPLDPGNRLPSWGFGLTKTDRIWPILECPWPRASERLDDSRIVLQFPFLESR